MKITKNRLKEIIKEELRVIEIDGDINEVSGGMSGLALAVQERIQEIIEEFGNSGIDLDAIEAIVGDMKADEEKYGADMPPME